MKQFKAFASQSRIRILLCSSATVLLTACGGNIDAGGEQLSASAASVSTDVGVVAPASTIAAAPAVEAIASALPAAPAAPAADTQAAPAPVTASASAQAPEAGTQAFELTGYGSNPLQTQAGQQDAPITH